jgi:hypothetical protein
MLRDLISSDPEKLQKLEAEIGLEHLVQYWLVAALTPRELRRSQELSRSMSCRTSASAIVASRCGATGHRRCSRGLKGFSRYAGN